MPSVCYDYGIPWYRNGQRWLFHPAYSSRRLIEAVGNPLFVVSMSTVITDKYVLHEWGTNRHPASKYPEYTNREVSQWTRKALIEPWAVFE